MQREYQQTAEAHHHQYGVQQTESALQIVARSVTSLHQICERFDIQSDVPCRTTARSTARSTRPDKEDVKKVVSIVLRNKLLVEIGHREHRSFQNLKLNPLHKWDVKKSEEWIRGKIREYQKFRGNHCSEVSESEIEWWDIVEYLPEENRNL